MSPSSSRSNLTGGRSCAAWCGRRCRRTRSTHEFILLIVAVFGTTISPYLFFWQAAQEMEDANGHVPHTARGGPAASAPHQVRHDHRHDLLEPDRLLHHPQHGATLHAAGITDIQTSAQAAEALRPLAGDLTFVLFGLGIIGTGLLAVPVLAGSAAYAVAETAGWPGSLSTRPEARPHRGSRLLRRDRGGDDRRRGPVLHARWTR